MFHLLDWELCRNALGMHVPMLTGLAAKDTYLNVCSYPLPLSEAATHFYREKELDQYRIFLPLLTKVADGVLP